MTAPLPVEETVTAGPDRQIAERIRLAITEVMERDQRALLMLRRVGWLIVASVFVGLIGFGIGLATGAGSPPAPMLGAALVGVSLAWIGLLFARLRLAQRMLDGSMVPRAGRRDGEKRYRLRGSFWKAIDQRIADMDYDLLVGVVRALDALGGQARLDAVARRANENLDQVFAAAITLHRAAILSPLSDVRGEVMLTPIGRDVAGPSRG